MGLLVAEREEAFAEDPAVSSPRTEALFRLAGIAQGGGIIDGAAPFSVTCSARAAWKVDMSSSERSSALRVAALAFDLDQEGPLTYRVVSGPLRGSLYAATGASSKVDGQVRGLLVGGAGEGGRERV